MTSQLEAPEKENNHGNVVGSKVPTIEEIAAASPVEQLEYQLSQMPDGFFPTEHLFLHGMYIRKIFMPAGSLLTSMQHKTTHPFVILSGKLRVMDQMEAVEYEAPFIGVTEAGTKRVLYIHEDTTWLTFHANPENISDPDEMVEYLTYPNKNPLFDKDDERINSWKKNRYEQEGIKIMETYTENTINDSGGELS
jgi:hypothetical protein